MASAQKRGGKGFRQASGFLAKRIREAGESRGFAVSRLLTHWPEIAGPEIAAHARPVEVTYGRGDFGATLTLLTSGAQAPLLQMQAEKLREKVNAVYGYAAIARIRITQTSASGFGEPQPAFGRAPEAPQAEPAPEAVDRAARASADVEDNGLREALSRLGAQVLSRHPTRTGNA